MKIDYRGMPNVGTIGDRFYVIEDCLNKYARFKV